MIKHLFAFKEHFSFAPPYKGEVERVWEKAKELSVKIECGTKCHSGTLIHANVAMTVLPDRYMPSHIIFPDGDKQEIIAVRELDDFSFLVFNKAHKSGPTLADLDYQPGRFIFKVGVEDSVPFVVSFGEIVNINRIDFGRLDINNDDVGSPLFSRTGDLFGMEMGEVKGVKIACSAKDMTIALELLRTQMKR